MALGHLPNAPNDPQTHKGTSVPESNELDLGDQAFVMARQRAVFRVHPTLFPKLKIASPAAAELFKMSKDPERNWSRSQVKDILKQLLEEEKYDWLNPQQKKVIRHLSFCKASELCIEDYPDFTGFVISSRIPMRADSKADVDSSKDEIESDPEALLEAARSQELFSHTADVRACVESYLAMLPLPDWKDGLVTAATLHDWGKANVALPGDVAIDITLRGNGKRSSFG